MRARLSGRDAPSDTTAYVHGPREQLKAVVHDHGAVHVQIGRADDLLGTRAPRVAALLKDIRHALDPPGLVNPGSLGL